MKTNIFRTLLLLAILSFGLSSCVDDNDDDFNSSDYDNFLDINVSTWTDNRGNFGSSPAQYYLSDLGLTNGGYVELRDTWIEVYNGDFRPGDVVDLSISINGVGTFICPKYYINQYMTSFIIDDATAPGLFNFMSHAMQYMSSYGNITVNMYGNYNVSNTNLNISLKNDLNVFF